MLREALKISSPLALVLRDVPRFHSGSLWHTTPVSGSQLNESEHGDCWARVRVRGVTMWTGEGGPRVGRGEPGTGGSM